MTVLHSIAANAHQTAYAIKNVVDVDVVIVDEQCSRIADTFGYGEDKIVIRSNSIIGMIVQTGKPLAIDDKNRFQSCRECEDRESCRMTSLIGVPIRFEDAVVGAIGLVIPEHSLKRLFDNLQYTLDFLEVMAGMLTSQLSAMKDRQRLKVVIHQEEMLMDTIPDAVAVLDEKGLITYANGEFNRIFFAGKRTVNIPVDMLLGQQKISACLKNSEDFSDLPIHYKYLNTTFDGFCSARNFNIDGSPYGAVITLKNAIKDLETTATGNTAEELVMNDLKHYLDKGMKKTKIAGILGISRATLYRMIKRMKGNNNHD